MSRPHLVEGTWGAISTTRVNANAFRSRCLFRNGDDRTVCVERNGKTPAKSRARLHAALGSMAAQVSGSAYLSHTVTDALYVLMAAKVSDSAVRPQTIAQYESAIRRRVTTSPFGRAIVLDVTTGMAETFFRSIIVESRTDAKVLRILLRQAFAILVRLDALRWNPIEGTTPVPRSKPAKTHLSLDDLARLRLQVRLWGEHVAQVHGGGQRRTQDMPVYVDLMLALGCRIGELCALRWEDVDFGVTPARVTVSGTAVRLKGTGLFRQDEPKTSKSIRTVHLPRFAETTLLDLRVDSTCEYVFPSDVGTLRDPHNLGRQWRAARGTEFSWVTGHTFRRTTAMLIEQEGSLSAASKQLGHSTTQITEQYYLSRPDLAPDVTAILERFSDDDRY